MFLLINIGFISLLNCQRNTAMNICVHIFMWKYFHWVYMWKQKYLIMCSTCIGSIPQKLYHFIFIFMEYERIFFFLFNIYHYLLPLLWTNSWVGRGAVLGTVSISPWKVLLRIFPWDVVYFLYRHVQWNDLLLFNFNQASCVLTVEL